MTSNIGFTGSIHPFPPRFAATTFPVAMLDSQSHLASRVTLTEMVLHQGRVVYCGVTFLSGDEKPRSVRSSRLDAHPIDPSIGLV